MKIDAYLPRTRVSHACAVCLKVFTLDPIVTTYSLFLYFLFELVLFFAPIKDPPSVEFPLLC